MKNSFSNPSDGGTRRITVLVLSMLSLATDGFSEDRAPQRDAESANRLVVQATQASSRHQSIEAKVRHRVRLFDQELIGSGLYRQLEVSGRIYVRYELKVPVGEQIASLQHVSNDRSLWIRRSMPSSEDPRRLFMTLTHVDLEEVRQALEQGGDRSDPALLGSLGAGQGGIADVLMRLERNFVFGTAYRATWHDVPMWVTTGRRKLPQKPAADALPADKATQIPDTVTIMLGQDDLFPYRIEYRRRTDDLRRFGRASVPREGSNKPNNKSKTVPMVVLEFFEVGFDVPIDARIYDYRPGRLREIDGTKEYIARFRMNKRK